MSKKELKDMQMMERYRVPAVARAMSLLEFFAKEGGERTVAQAAAAVDLPVNSVFRILLTLSEAGYVERVAGTKLYRLSRKLLHVGYGAMAGEGMVERASPVLRRLRDETGETVLIGTVRRSEGVVLECFASLHPVKVVVGIGHNFPLHTSAPGKAFLAFSKKEDRDVVLAGLAYTSKTANTITSRAAFEAELERAAEAGYAVDDEEELLDLRCVSAPVLGKRGTAVAAIWVTGPAYRLGTKDFPAMGRQVMEAALEISGGQGYAGGAWWRAEDGASIPTSSKNNNP